MFDRNTHHSALAFHQARNGFRCKLLVMVTAVSSLRATGEGRRDEREREEQGDAVPCPLSGLSIT